MSQHLDVGTGPGTKGVGTDSGAGKRAPVTNPVSGPGTPGADGGVKQAGGSGRSVSQAQAPATQRSDSGAPSTGPGSPTAAPGTGGGVKSVPNAGSGRGGPSTPIPSARRLAPSAAPSLPDVAETSLEPASTNQQELANRAGLTFTG